MAMFKHFPGTAATLAAMLATAAMALAAGSPAVSAADRATGSPPPSVVASIRPVQSLVQMVLGEHGEVGLLMESGETPHGGALKPSQRRMIADAALVFVIDEEFERFLAKPLAGRDGVVALADSPGLELLPARLELRFAEAGAGRDGHGHGSEGHDGHGHGGEGHDGHGHGSEDFHVWLDPRNATLMLRRIEGELAGLMPRHKDDFAANAKAAEAGLAALDAEVAVRMEAARDLRFITFHDAYQYLESRYGLTATASVHDLHGAAVSASRLRLVADMMRYEGVRCIFTEPQFDGKLAVVLQHANNAKVAVMDPLGADIPPGAGHYPAMIRALAGSIEGCLGH